MKKSFFLILIGLLASCSTENTSSEDNPEQNTTSGTILKTVKKYDTNGVLEFETLYEYNSEGNISKLTQEYIYGTKIETTFNYDANGDIISYVKVETDPFGDVTTFVNNVTVENDLIVKVCQEITHTDGPSSFDYPEVDKIEFVYDDAGNAQLFTHYYPIEAENNTCDDVEEVDFTETLDYDGDGNMMRYENSNSFFSNTYYKYTYDNTKHPYANIKPEAYRRLLGYSAVNNIIITEEYNADTDELVGSVSFEYEFNSNDFPTKITKNYSSGIFSQTTVFEYTYY